MGGEYHDTVAVRYAFVRICGDVLKELEDCAFYFLSGSCLMGANCTEYIDEFIVNSSCVIQEGMNNYLDLFDSGFIQVWDCVFIGCDLRLGSVCDSSMFVR